MPRAGLSEALLAHIKLHKPFAIELRMLTKAGVARHVQIHGQAVWNTEGRAVRMAGVVSDITERRATQDALFEEKERAQVTLKSIGDAVITTDLAGCVAYLKPGSGKNDRLGQRRSLRQAAHRSV